MRGAVILAVWGLAFASGCANHVRYLELESEEVDVQVKHVHYEVRADQELIEVAKVPLDLLKEETLETHKRLDLTRVEEFTPYSAARELYEVPGGLVSIPLSLLLSSMDFILLGYIPENIVDGFTFWTFAAANPFLNTENEDRLQRRNISVRPGTTEVRQAVSPGRLANWPVEVRLDERPKMELSTDSRGRLAVHVLDLAAPYPDNPPRKLKIAFQAPGGSGQWVEREYFLDRTLATRVHDAREALRWAADSGAAAEELSRAILELDRLGFRAYSLRLEDDVYSRYGSDEAFLAEFRHNLDRVYREDGRSLPADAAPNE